MVDININGLLQTIREDKTEVLNGLHKQDHDKAFSTAEVIALLELSFTLVEASIMTEMKDALSYE